MKMKYFCFGMMMVLAAPLYCRAQSTAFTYQGRLDDGGTPANGIYDLTFALYDSASGGNQLGTTITNASVGVNNGLFTLQLDFGDYFSGPDRWLEIGVRANGGGTFALLNPRQLMGTTPYAMRASNAATAATASSVNAANISGTIALGQIPTDVALRTGGNNFTGAQFISGTGSITGALYVNSPGFSTAASIFRARPGDQFPLAAQSLSGVNLLLVSTNGQVNVSGPFYAGGVINGDGSGLTTLSASSLSSGTVSDARLSTNVALHTSANTFVGTQTINGALNVNGRYSGIGDFRLYAFQGDGNNGTAFIQARDSSGTSSIDLALRSQLSGALVDAMRIRSNGNVGIFNSSPDFPLSFASSLGDKISLYGSAGASFGFGVQSGRLQIHSDLSVNDIVFGSGPSSNMVETVRFKGNGNVGIGTTNPTSKLTIAAPNGGLEHTDGTVRLGTYVDASGGWIGTYSAHDLLFFVNNGGTPAAVIHAANNNSEFTGEVFCTAVNLTSDRNAKEQFRPVNAREVLDKVAHMPISEWQYKRDRAEADPARHIGPMAQDFHEAFALGHDDKHITSVDADGVALAAIQGLNEMVQEKDQRIRQLETAVAELKQMMGKLTAQREGSAQ